MPPGEIKWREVSWTLTKKLNFICGSRRGQGEGGGDGPSREPRRDQLSREMELGSESWACLLLQLLLNSSATPDILSL